MQQIEKTEPKKLLINRTELKQMGIHVSNTTLLRWEETGNFPKRIKLSNSSVAWLFAEIEDWVMNISQQRER